MIWPVPSGQHGIMIAARIRPGIQYKAAANLAGKPVKRSVRMVKLPTPRRVGGEQIDDGDGTRQLMHKIGNFGPHVR